MSSGSPSVAPDGMSEITRWGTTWPRSSRPASHGSGRPTHRERGCSSGTGTRSPTTDALDQAALYTSYLRPCERLAPYAGLWQTPLGFDPWELLDERLPSPSAFFFETPGEPTADDIDRLIADTFTDVIDRWRAHLPVTRLTGDGEVAFPTELAEIVEYFANRGRSLNRAWTGGDLPR